MTSPAVWDYVRPIIANGAAELSIPVTWPNSTDNAPDPPAMFIDVDFSAYGAEPLELGGGMWEERGTIHLHILVPTGRGVSDGLLLRKRAANWFRGRPVEYVCVFDSFSFDPGSPDEDGNWFRLSLRVHYRYQDAVEE